MIIFTFVIKHFFASEWHGNDYKIWREEKEKRAREKDYDNEE